MRRKTMVLAGFHWFILVFCHIVLCSHSLRHHHGHAATAILSAEEASVGGPSSSSASSLVASSSSSSSSSLSSSSTSNVNNGPPEDPHKQQQKSLLLVEQSKQTLEDGSEDEGDAADDSDLLSESSPLIMGSPSTSVLLEQEEKPHEQQSIMHQQQQLQLQQQQKQQERKLKLHSSISGNNDDDAVDEEDEESVLRSPPSLINEDPSRITSDASSSSIISSSGVSHSKINSGSSSSSSNAVRSSSDSSDTKSKKQQSLTEDEEEEEDDVLNDEPARPENSHSDLLHASESLLHFLQRDSPAPALAATSPVLIHKIKVKPGHELKLKCNLNNTYGRITWLLNGNAIRTDNGRYSIQGPTSRDRSVEGRLTINNVLPEDNGVWQCHETKFDGKEHISRPIWVIVLAAPRAVHLEFDGRRISPSQPMVTTSASTRVTYREKDNVSIQCVVEGGNPPPKVYWYVGNKNLTNSSQIRSEYLEDDKIYITRSSLVIGNISRTEHNKSVVCIVDHELLNHGSGGGAGASVGAITSPGSMASSNILQDSAPQAPTSLALSSSYLRAMAHFNVEYAPSFVISRNPGFGYPIKEGIYMALKCEVDANPPSRPQWMKDGGDPPVPQSEDGFLNFSTVNRNHTGWYKCISHHPLGKFSSVGYYLTVRFEPTIVHQPPPRLEANLGDKVHLKCAADGRPSPALCWSRIGYGGSLTTVGSGQDLILDKILYQEAGNYRCVAQNRVGLEEKRAQTNDVLVAVTGRPVVYPTNRTIIGFSGQPLSLSVEVCSNPAPERAFWIFGNVALKPGSKHKNKYVAQKLTINDRSVDCYLAVLTILTITEDDAGEFIFFAKNNKGIHEGSVQLNITQASYSVSTSRAFGDLHNSPSSSTSGLHVTHTLESLYLPLFILYYNHVRKNSVFP